MLSNDVEIKTEDLRLSDYELIQTKFCFLDETGSLGNPTDPYFAMGVLKMSQPYYFQNLLMRERSRRRFYDEIKFNHLSRHNVEFAKFVVGSFFGLENIDFCSYVVNKNSQYFKDTFDSNQWIAYEQIALKLLGLVIADREVLTVIADNITSPKEVRFEINIKKSFNLDKNYLALAGACRFDSLSNDLLQVTDLLVGAVVYDFKLHYKLVAGSRYKTEITKFIKKKLGILSFADGFTRKNFNVFVGK